MLSPVLPALYVRQRIWGLEIVGRDESAFAIEVTPLAPIQLRKARAVFDIEHHRLGFAGQETSANQAPPRADESAIEILVVAADGEQARLQRGAERERDGDELVVEAERVAVLPLGFGDEPSVLLYRVGPRVAKIAAID